MKHVAPIFLFVIIAAAPVAAQRLQVEAGGAIAAAYPGNDALGHDVHLVPVVRLAPAKGWGIAAGLNWFRAPLAGHADGDHIDVRPFMGGYGYTFVIRGSFSTISVVAGPGWDTIRIDGHSSDTASFAVRPSASISIPIAGRVSATAFGGYLWNRPTFAKSVTPRTWSTDAPVFSVGAVVRLF